MSHWEMPQHPEWMTYACRPSGVSAIWRDPVPGIGTSAGDFGVSPPAAPMSYCDTVSGSPVFTTYRLRPSGDTVRPQGLLPAPTGDPGLGVGTPVAERSKMLTAPLPLPSSPVAYRWRPSGVTAT